MENSPSLLEDLVTGSPERRLEAAQTLAAKVDLALVPEQDPLDSIRDVLDAEWVRVGSDRSRLVEPLVSVLTEFPQTLLGHAAASALATLGEDGVTALAALLTHSFFPIRFIAAEGLAVAGQRARWVTRQSIIHSLALDDRWLANTNLVRALGRIGGEESLQLLASLTKTVHRIWEGRPERQQQMWPALMAALSEARLKEVLEGQGKPDGPD